MSATSTRERVEAALDGLAFRFSAADAGSIAGTRDGMLVIGVERTDLRLILKRLKERAGFEQNTFVTAVDLFPAEPRFEVLHQLLSYRHVDRVRVRTLVRSDDAWVPTCSDLWPGASFSERECWDLFGLRFEGLSDHRRLMMPEEYGYHPLRKDFPHQGIEPDRLYREWERRRALSAAAPFAATAVETPT